MLLQRAQRNAKIMAEAMVSGQANPRVLRQSEKENSTYLPRPQATQLMIAEVTASANQHPDVYVSTPITGGSRLVSFLKEHHCKSKHDLTPAQLKKYQSEVIVKNCQHAHEVAEGLRQSGQQVVEPSRIEMPGWTQTHYNENWSEVVNQLPLKEMRVCDGWQLSFGCLVEVRTALDRGIKVTDEQGHTLSRKQAQQQVKAALAEARGLGVDMPILPRVLVAPMKTLPMEI